jgi:hypothetical protein
MTQRTRSSLGVITAVALALLVTPGTGYSQTDGMKRRGDARDTRQKGRDAARDAKQDCKENDSRSECRQQKRGTKQDTREEARDIRQGD